MIGTVRKLGHFNDDAETLEFVDSRDFPALAAMGTSCPDHFLRTKIAPLTLDPERIDDMEYLRKSLDEYRRAYAQYYARCASRHDPAMRDANPVVVLLPGVGRFAFAADRTTARLASEFYGNAINVIRGATAIGAYVRLPESEAFAIEYWALEEAKLQRMAKPKPLAGRVALITGGAGGIGLAAAKRLLAHGACVMVLDRDVDALKASLAALDETYGRDVVRSAVCDVTDEAQVQAAFDACAREFGGLDILVANAGLASAAPIEETTVALWHKNYDVLAQGYFLTARAAFPLMPPAEGRIYRLHRLKKRAGRDAECFCVCVGKSGIGASCPLSGARGRGIRNPGQCRESRCGDPRLPHLGRRLAQGARQRLWNRCGPGTRGILSQALLAEAKCAARRCRRGDLFPGL